MHETLDIITMGVLVNNFNALNSFINCNALKMLHYHSIASIIFQYKNNGL
jgi:hypothetical protein